MNIPISGMSRFLLILLLALLPCACNNHSGTGGAILVTVTDQAGNQLPGATVVLGDSNGAMLANGTTDGSGQIVFNDCPMNATISAGYTCMKSELSYTYYSFDMKYDVNAPVNLNLLSCAPSPSPSSGATFTTFGTAVVNVTNMAGITQNTIQSNQPLFSSTPLITQQTLTITSNDLQEDGAFSLIVTGKDANGVSIAYGALLDQNFTDGMTVDIAVDQPMSYVQYQITNIPTAGELCHSLSQARTGKGHIFIDDCLSLSSAPTSTLVNMAYIPGLGDQFSYGVSVYTSHDNGDGSTVSSTQYFDLDGPPASVSPTDQVIDFGQALSAPTALTVSAANSATPTLSWSGVDPRATTYMLYANLRPTSARFLSFRIDDLSPTRTHVTFPELPDSLAAFRPTGVNAFSVFVSADLGSYRSASSSRYDKFLP